MSKKSRTTRAVERLALLATGAAIAMVAWTLLQPAAPGPAEQAPPRVVTLDVRDLQQHFATLARQVAPSVVAIHVQTTIPTADSVVTRHSSGSGVVIERGSYVLTNEHVLRGLDRVDVVLHDGRSLAAQVVGRDIRSDLAVLYVPTDLPAVSIKPLAQLRKGDWVAALGNPLGMAQRDGEAVMTVGVISRFGAVLSGLGLAEDRLYANMIQTSTPLAPGHSGGPLIDLDGRLAGINTALSIRVPASGPAGEAAEAKIRAVTESIGFAISFSPRTMAIIQQLRQGRPVRYGWLGIDSDGPAALPEGEVLGVRIRSLYAGGPAEQAGVQRGDILTTLDGQSVRSVDELARLEGACPVGHLAEAVLLRDGASVTVALVVADRQEGLRAAGADGYLWRGMLVQDRVRGGVMVLEVEKDSLAEKAGLSSGSVILGVDGALVQDVARFRLVVQDRRDAVRLSLNDGATATVAPQ